MNPEARGKPGWPLAWAIAVWLVVAAAPSRAQSQRKSPPGPSASQETAEPLAPLLQQAKDAMDKMDFTAALEPLEKYIAQRPDDSYAHFQLGYSLCGLEAARRRQN